MANAEALKSKYSIAPSPDSVARLGKLVSDRLDDVDKIVQLISNDAVLKQRLLLTANNGDPDGGIDDVDSAIMRCGVESVLVVAMTDPLAKAVVKTFSTMLGIAMEQTDLVGNETFGDTCFVSSASFSGNANGIVHFRLKEGLARQAAGAILGGDGGDYSMDEAVEVVSELTNMVAGNFKSNLCDANLECKLSTPTVTPGGSFQLAKAVPGRRQELCFVNDSQYIMVSVTIESLE